MNQNDQQTVNAIRGFKPFQWLGTLFCKISKRTIIDIIIIAIPIILIYIYFFGMGTPPEIKEALKENKKIELKVDSLKTDNQFIVERMYELERKQTLFFDMINQNNDLIKENNKELVRLKRIYNAKINSINNYNISQLDSFFTNRYKKYYNR